jgi:hypothetical protein
MAQKRKRIKHKATFEERLAEEAIKIKEAAEKQPPDSTAKRTAVAASPAGRDGRPHERLATVARFAAAEVKTLRVRAAPKLRPARIGFMMKAWWVPPDHNGRASSAATHAGRLRSALAAAELQ